VLVATPPNADLAAAIEQVGARIVLLQQIEGGSRDPAEALAANLNAITGALAPR
jgi:hypothetical protein